MSFWKNTILGFVPDKNDTDPTMSKKSEEKIVNIGNLQAIKKCPFCAEEIQNIAIKCKHCKSDLSKPKNDNLAKHTGLAISSLLLGVFSIFLDQLE